MSNPSLYTLRNIISEKGKFYAFRFVNDSGNFFDFGKNFFQRLFISHPKYNFSSISSAKKFIKNNNGLRYMLRINTFIELYFDNSSIKVIEKEDYNNAIVISGNVVEQHHDCIFNMSSESVLAKTSQALTASQHFIHSYILPYLNVRDYIYDISSNGDISYILVPILTNKDENMDTILNSYMNEIQRLFILNNNIIDVRLFKPSKDGFCGDCGIIMTFSNNFSIQMSKEDGFVFTYKNNPYLKYNFDCVYSLLDAKDIVSNIRKNYKYNPFFTFQKQFTNTYIPYKRLIFDEKNSRKNLSIFWNVCGTVLISKLNQEEDENIIKNINSLDLIKELSTEDLKFTLKEDGSVKILTIKTTIDFSRLPVDKNQLMDAIREEVSGIMSFANALNMMFCGNEIIIYIDYGLQ